MKDKELKTLLIKAYELESNLYDFCIECLNKIYGDDAKEAIFMFDEDIEEGMDWNGCLQSLSTFDHNLKMRLKDHEEMKRVREANAITESKE